MQGIYLFFPKVFITEQSEFVLRFTSVTGRMVYFVIIDLLFFLYGNYIHCAIFSTLTIVAWSYQYEWIIYKNQNIIIRHLLFAKVCSENEVLKNEINKFSITRTTAGESLLYEYYLTTISTKRILIGFSYKKGKMETLNEIIQKYI